MPDAAIRQSQHCPVIAAAIRVWREGDLDWAGSMTEAAVTLSEMSISLRKQLIKDRQGDTRPLVTQALDDSESLTILRELVAGWSTDDDPKRPCSYCSAAFVLDVQHHYKGCAYRRAVAKVGRPA